MPCPPLWSAADGLEMPKNEVFPCLNPPIQVRSPIQTPYKLLFGGGFPPKVTTVFGELINAPATLSSYCFGRSHDLDECLGALEVEQKVDFTSPGPCSLASVDERCGGENGRGSCTAWRTSC